MIILGIDPGTATTGFGVIRYKNNKELILLDYGCIETSKSDPTPKRLQNIAKDIEEITNLWKPDTIAIEEVFFSKNVKTAMSVAHARGVIVEKISEKNDDIHEYKPNQIKEAVCGYGKADKKQVQRMVKIILNMNEIPRPDDASDALAVAICHSNVVQFNKQIQKQQIYS